MPSTVIKVIDLVPGDVQPLTTVQAESLTEKIFWDQYVRTHRPVLIKGAAAGWPALERWKRPGYLEDRCGDAVVFVNSTFNCSPVVLHAAEKRQRLDESIGEIRNSADDATVSIPAMDVPEQWLADIGVFHFLRTRSRRPLVYRQDRIFLYRNASTDWHYHALDETLTSQLVGSKLISLFRLTSANWQTFAPLIEVNYHHMSCADRFFPTDVRLTKYQGVMDAGDAIYIPPFWWHGIDAANPDPGITLAHCFRSPLSRFGDWQEPVTRELVSKALRYDKLRLLPLLALILLSSLSRRIKKEPWIAA